jgi:Cu(I)/Ag(I) efflux system protein CusF
MGKILALIIAGTVSFAGHGAIAQSTLIDGQVVKIDPSAGKITIRHGPIPKLGMEQGMTMVFKAGDGATLKTLKPGDRVKFDAEQVNGQFTVTTIEKTR